MVYNMLINVNSVFYLLILILSYLQILIPFHLFPFITILFLNKLKCLNFNAKTYNFIDIFPQNNQIFFI